jgi:hypothetical protein
MKTMQVLWRGGSLLSAVFALAIMLGCGGGSSGGSTGGSTDSATGGSVSTPSISSYFPLTPAARSWTFSGPTTVQWNSGGQVTFQGITCVQFNGGWNANAPQTYFNWATSPVTLQQIGTAQSNKSYSIYTPPITMIPANITAGYTWSQNVAENNYAATGGLTGTTTATISGTIVGIEQLTVPAGTYNNALHVSYSINSSGTVTQGDFWFVPNIGWVKANNGGVIFALSAYTTQ